jgi:hypothetical protein
VIALFLLGCIPPGTQGPAGTVYEPDTGWDAIEETGCVPDEDPALSAKELAFDPAVVSKARGDSLSIDADNWNFSGGSVSIELQLRDLGDFWFADRFTGATHVAALDLNADNWGIYRTDETGLWLLGIASNTPNHTALAYSPGVVLWETPLTAGGAWDTDAEATGLFEGDAFPMDMGLGNEVTLVHHYAVRADGAGEVIVDAGTYAAQRVHIGLVAVGTDNFGWEWGREAADTWLFMAPCTGLVARVTDHEFLGLGL